MIIDVLVADRALKVTARTYGMRWPRARDLLRRSLNFWPKVKDRVWKRIDERDLMARGLAAAWCCERHCKRFMVADERPLTDDAVAELDAYGELTAFTPRTLELWEREFLYGRVNPPPREFNLLLPIRSMPQR